jgi:16S rRNA (uracil1498-N3)-methyltransferase
VSAFWVHVERCEAAGSLVLSAEEARHVQARRLRVGDTLTAFDGAGRVAAARLVSAARRETTIELDAPVVHPRPQDPFVLASAVPKGDRLSTLLQMLTQLGVVRWQPLILDDSAVRSLDPDSPRLRRVLLESAKLARRPWCMGIEAPTDLEGALARWGRGGERVWFGDVGGRSGALPPAAQLMLIGPEAGFSPRERGVLDGIAARAVALSDYNLRIEVAAIAAATAHRIGAAAASLGKDAEGEGT